MEAQAIIGYEEYKELISIKEALLSKDNSIIRIKEGGGAYSYCNNYIVTDSENVNKLLSERNIRLNAEILKLNDIIMEKDIIIKKHKSFF